MTERPTFHEDLTHGDEVKAGSERSFGIVFAVVFTIIGLFPLLDGGAPHIWAISVAGVFLALAFVAPRLLAPLNRGWFLFGMVLHKVVNPLIMGLMFYVTITPIGLLMRAFGKKPLDLDFDRNADSYWVHRSTPKPESMKRQF
ncbi:MAG: hypothetical protein HOL37_04420 [Rhodospirillaceae bacterium]|jgi:hypothetical protein|nr:hypothetical protein [Rhodospirillaceae bacterium]MBT4464091.1 hypothetical protein [Rhodospirillaceae bacterium]MBT5308561.1 hypothetical protein [Rhodospirillaceae bacterium]MBT7355332.1 hypothetical protein [Rhodospirillaceae bacterium]